MARLFHHHLGELLGTVELTHYDVIVGRQQDCDLILRSPSASRQHLRFSPKRDGGWLMVDLKSENGTYVDGVREYRKLLTERAVIQIGEEMLVFEPFGEVETTDGGTPKFRALPEPMSQARFKERDEGEITQHIAPAVQRRALASARGRLRPHLVLETKHGDAVFPLDTTVTAIGYGNVKVSMGTPEKNNDEVLAEVVFRKDGVWTVHAKGLFGRIEVAGKSVSRWALEPGDQFTVDGHVLRFEHGISELAWGN